MAFLKCVFTGVAVGILVMVVGGAALLFGPLMFPRNAGIWHWMVVGDPELFLLFILGFGLGFFWTRRRENVGRH